MSLPLTAVHPTMSVPKRLLLFVLAAITGALGGYGWNLELSDIPYHALLQAFLDPAFQIESLTVAIALGFISGFAHIFRICYLPGALAMMPLLHATQNKREFLKVSLILIVSMVTVSALWGVLVGVPAAALAATVGSRHVMGLIMQPALTVIGLVMLVIALGELGLMRRVLPDFHVPEHVVQDASRLAERSSYRPPLVLGIAMAATFGIVRNRPFYLVLLVYVAVVGGMGYGALALGAYGLGLSSSLVIAALLLIPAGRSRRLMAWFGERQEALHVLQGFSFAFMGAMSVAWFTLRYVVPLE